MDVESFLPLVRGCQLVAFGVIRSRWPGRRPWRRRPCPWRQRAAIQSQRTADFPQSTKSKTRRFDRRCGLAISRLSNQQFGDSGPDGNRTAFPQARCLRL